MRIPFEENFIIIIYIYIYIYIFFTNTKAPRSYETLYLCLKKKKSLLEINPYGMILNELVSPPTIGDQRLNVSAVTFEQVIAALRGKPLKINHQLQAICGFLKRVDSLVADGVFINSLTADDNEIVPHLSVVSIYGWARNTIDSQDVTTKEKQIAACLMKMILVEDRFDGYAYEKFHGLWELLYCLLFEDELKNPCSLSEFYRVNTSKASLNERKICFSPKSALKQLQSNFTDTLLKDEDGNTITKNDISNYIILPAANNPGFDQIEDLKKIKLGNVLQSTPKINSQM